MNAHRRVLRRALELFLFVGMLVALAALRPAPIAHAASIVVNTTADVSATNCTLRDAITAANTNTATGGCIAGSAGLDTISFSVTGTITLGSSLPLITQNLTIAGPGAPSLTVSGNNNFPVFDMNSVTLNLQNLTVANGKCTSCAGGGLGDGGGTANIVNVIFLNNHADSDGGAIYNAAGGTLSVVNSTFTNNSSKPSISAGYGGAIDNRAGSVATVTGSTFSGNRADYGGAIAATGSTLTVANSTFSGNTSTLFGGAISTNGGDASTVTVINSTFSGNATSATAGGAIEGGSGATTLRNTILANSVGSKNCDGTITDGGNNLQFGGTVANSCGASIPTGNPLLAALANNGGPTQTMALQVGSAAVDRGNNAVCAASPVNNVDQRGISRPQPSGGTCDIGAYELVQLPAPAEVPEADTLLLMGGGLGGLATWLGWQRSKRRARK